MELTPVQRDPKVLVQAGVVPGLQALTPKEDASIAAFPPTISGEKQAEQYPLALRIQMS